MMFLEDTDWPKIPDNLLESSSDILSKCSSVDSGLIFKFTYKTGDYIIHGVRVNDDLCQWIKKIIPENVFIQYGIYYSEAELHIDVHRTYAYNNVLYPGGEDVENIAMIDNILVRQKPEINKWYKVNNSIPHGTIGEYDSPRIILHVTPLAAWTYNELLSMTKYIRSKSSNDLRGEVPGNKNLIIY